MSLSGIGIKARLYSGLGALVVACAGIASFATYQQWAIQGQVTKLGLIGENTARVLQISADLEALRRANLRYMYDADEASYTEAGEREAIATRLLKEAAKAIASEERRKIYSEVEVNVGQLRAKRDELGETVKKLTTGKAMLLAAGDRLAAEAAKKATASPNRLRNSNLARVQRFIRDVPSRTKRCRMRSEKRRTRHHAPRRQGQRWWLVAGHILAQV